MNPMMKYGLIALFIGGIYIYNNSGDGTSYTEDDIDLNAVLDVTVETLYSFEESLGTTEDRVDVDESYPDQAFVEFSQALAHDYNAAVPVLYKSTIGVSPQQDASLIAFDDTNANGQFEEGEDGLFKIEIDGENARIIASSRSGAVNDHHFSGSGLLAGYLIGSMLSRQSAAGVKPSSLANKQPQTAKAAARARAGSGSHSSGK